MQELQLHLTYLLIVIELVAFAWLIIDIQKSKKKQDRIIELEQQILQVEHQILQLENNAQDAVSAGGLQNKLILSCTGRNIAFIKKIFENIQGYENIEHFESGDDDLLMQKINSHLQN